MKRIAQRRLAEVIRRYGLAGRVLPGDDRDPVAVHLLMHDLRAIRHPDLPDEMTGAEAVMLMPKAVERPHAGMRVAVGDALWIIETVVPLHAESARLFQIQLSQAVVPRQ